METTILQIRNSETNKAINLEIKVTDIEKFKEFIGNPVFKYTFEEKVEEVVDIQ